ncbi:MAG: MOSC domain-containing protein [Steroidobacteraceae bacterium]
MPTPRLQALHVYPLKSARGLSLARTTVGASGLAWDRHWMVVRSDGTFLTQRTHPRLARIATELTPEGLRLSREDGAPLLLPYQAPPPARPVRIWRDLCTGIDAGESAAAWVGALLGEPVRVVHAPPSPARHADPHYTGPDPPPLAFPDGFPLLVCTQASLDALNERLGAQLSMSRFRPNLVLTGVEPFAEDRFDTLRIGEVTVRLVKPCTRCIIPARDPLTGDADIDPMPVLRSFRFDPQLRGVTFGVNAVISAGVGETLERESLCEVTYRDR